MRIRRWVVYRFDTAPPPYDFVKKISVHFTKRRAERVRKRLGPNVKEFINAGATNYPEPDFYFSVSKLPRKRIKIFFKISQPVVIRKINGWFTIFWLVWFIPAIALKGLRDSVFLVALYSIWANLISHYTAWMASRVEVREEDIEKSET